MIIEKKIKLIRQKESFNRNIKSQKEFADILDISLSTLKNYESGRTAPPLNFIISLCHHFQLNANIFTDDTIFRNYLRRNISRDYELIKLGLIYIFEGIGTQVAHNDLFLSNLAKNKALKHFFDFLDPNLGEDIKMKMPFVESIIKTIDNTVDALEQSIAVTKHFGYSLKGSVRIVNDINALLDIREINGIANSLKKNNNFQEFSVNNKDFEIFIQNISIFLATVSDLQSLEILGKKTCNSIKDSIITYEQIIENLLANRDIHLQDFKKLYLKIDEEEMHK